VPNVLTFVARADATPRRCVWQRGKHASPPTNTSPLRVPTMMRGVVALLQQLDLVQHVGPVEVANVFGLSWR